MKTSSRLSFRSIKTKLLAWFLVLGLVPLLVVAVVAYRQSRNALEDFAGKDLQEIGEATLDKLDRTLFERYGDVQAFASLAIARANPEVIVPALNRLTPLYGCYDLMIVADAEGNIIAVNSVDDVGRPMDTSMILGKSVKNEEWFQKCISGGVSDGEALATDLGEDKLEAAATKSRGLAIGFSAPVLDEKGKPYRVWSNRVSWKRVGQQIAKEARQGARDKGLKSFDLLLLSKKGVVLDDLDANVILSLNLLEQGHPAAKALADGKSGFMTATNTRTHVVQFNGYASEQGYGTYKGNGWGVLARLDQAEALAPVFAIRRVMVIVAGAAAVIIALLSLMIASGFVRPILTSVKLMEAMAAGDLTGRLKSRSRDEIGRMADALNHTLETMSGTIRTITASAHSLSAASEESGAIGQQLSNHAEETTNQAGVVSAAAEQVSKNIQTVASGSEEMSASIKEIANNANEAARVATTAVTVAEITNATVAKLGDSSAEIGNVIKTITGIAQQTNLLALNATIEAARAGEAGKGFAVVANEVKELAKETAKATDDISKKIEAIQQDTKGAVKAIGEITAVINRINDLQTAIAGAVEEQTATTNEIGRNVSEAAKGSAEIAQNITGVASAAQQTSAAATDSRTSSAELARMATELSKLVSQFKVSDEASSAASGAAPKSNGAANDGQAKANARPDRTLKSEIARAV